MAAEWAGFETILMVENNPYCQKVLKKHWPDVPIIGDIKDVTKETVENATSQRSGGKSGNSLHKGRAASEGGRREPSFKDQWAVEPDVGRVAHGIPSRVDRLKGLGNAVVPAQIFPILQAIADIEKGDKVI